MPHIFNRRDLTFQLYEVLNLEKLCNNSLYRDHHTDDFEQLIDLVERMAEELFQPHAAKVDANEPTFKEGQVEIIPEVKKALDAFIESGLPAASFSYSEGGMQLPYAVTQAMAFIFAAANVSTSAYPLLSLGVANLLSACGSDEQKQKFLKPLIEGRYFGTMCLSETQAGSSLADIKTQAVPQSDGSYLITGNKMWISGGEHNLSENIIHMVLAKIPGGDAGVKGISLFIVPKFMVDDAGSLGARNDVVLAGLNHKMGYRGTVNTVLNFGENEGAVGYLVGEAGKGLSYMFHMMNEARIAVGLGATALAYTGYLHALDYATDRKQGRPLNQKDPSSPMVPIIEHTDVKRMLIQQKSYAEGGLALGLYCAQLVDQQRIAISEGQMKAAKAHELLLDILTPIAKSWPSEYGLKANEQAIQVHGGYGYTRDYPVERFYRDNRLNHIHEGTKGIQGLDLLGRKVTQFEGQSTQLLIQAIQATLAEVKDPALQPMAADLASHLQLIIATTQGMQAQIPNKGIDAYLANASLYLDAFGHVVVAWMWLQQAHTAVTAMSEAVNDTDRQFYQGKIKTCQYFFRYELPNIKPALELLAEMDTTCMDFDLGLF
ncbi:acyl-CoA dehydrogenase [Marinicella sp. S1101]|uniref:acyl-CoA dehydrogenase n=1 Tax=Marinicella marina TaxID=2996016 RepID=UPI002260A31B|nr:acyl-CoA dehydrogenase [Marinicella marina]MCX7554683.1 acyl-CoA dehydrogenase [Marinicella marina]MDJ1140748.1 acyl-CoA dehydrogenase [Marinicella marina]